MRSAAVKTKKYAYCTAIFLRLDYTCDTSANACGYCLASLTCSVRMRRKIESRSAFMVTSILVWFSKSRTTCWYRRLLKSLKVCSAWFAWRNWASLREEARSRPAREDGPR